MFNKKFFSIIAMVLVVAALFCACGQTVKSQPNGSVAVAYDASCPLQLTHAKLVVPLEGVTPILRVHGNEKGENLQWSSSNPEVVEPRDKWLYSKAVGTAVITCTDGVNTATCEVTVTEEPMGEYVLRVNQVDVSMKTGEVMEGGCTYTGPGAVAVHSSDTGVVAVENGMYKAVAPGCAYITYSDGLRHSQCKIVVE